MAKKKNAKTPSKASRRAGNRASKPASAGRKTGKGAKSAKNMKSAKSVKPGKPVTKSGAGTHSKGAATTGKSPRSKPKAPPTKAASAHGSKAGSSRPSPRPAGKPAGGSKSGQEASPAFKANIFGNARIAMPSEEPRKAPSKSETASVSEVSKITSSSAGKVKTTLSKKQIDYFREMLLKRRREILGDVQSLEAEALRQNSAGDLSHVPQHIADMGTDTYDQEFSLRLAATEREMLAEIDAALKRIEEGTYGMCEATGKPIGIARLEAKPWARVTIEVARERDRLPSYKR